MAIIATFGIHRYYTTMQLLTLLLIFVASYALLQWIALPALERRTASEKEVKKFISLKVTGAVLELLKTTAFFAAIAYGAFVLLYGAGWLFTDTSSVESIAAKLLSVSKVADWVDGIDAVWGTVAFAAVIATLIFHARKQVTAKYNTIYRDLYEQAFNSVHAEMQNDQLTEMPPTADQVKLMELLQATNEQLEELEAYVAENPEEAPRLADMKADIENRMQELREAYYFFEISRRVEVAPKELDSRVQLEFGRNWFANKSLLNVFSKGGAALQGVGLVLLFLSLIAVSTPTMTGQLTSAKASLSEWIIAANQEEATKLLEQARSQFTTSEADTTPEFTPEDEALIDAYTEAFAAELLANLLPDIMDSTQAQRTRAELKALDVRNKILERAVDLNPPHGKAPRANAESISRNLSMSKANGLSELEKDLARSFEHLHARPKEVPSVKSRLKAELMSDLRTKPQLWDELRPKIIQHKVAHAQVKRTSGLSRKLFSSIIGNASDLAGLEFISAESELGKFADDVLQTMGTEAIETYYDIHSKRFLAKSYGGASVEEALAELVKSGPERASISEAARSNASAFNRVVSKEAALVEALQQVPPSINAHDVRTSAASVADLTEALRTSSTSASGGEAVLELATETMANFGDYFSPQHDHASKTPRGRKMSAWSAGSGSSRSASRSFTRSFSRARSFRMLRAFSRVGGVLIGREADAANSALNFHGMRWSETEGQLSLHLQRHDGVEIALGPYHKSTINHALTYAADGRPVAVTMVKSYPLAELKVLMHPALIDTRLGCRVTNIDRFVDKYTGTLQAREKAHEIANRQLRAYNWATHARRWGFLQYFVETQPQSIAELQGILVQTQEAVNDGELLNEILDMRENVSEYWEATNILKVKTDYFDQELVAMMDLMMRDDVSEVDALSLIYEQHRQSASYASELDQEQWFSEPASFQFWSGVREKQFTPDPNLDFLQFDRAAPLRASTFPLNYMDQVAFTSFPVFSNAADVEDYIDEEPYELHLRGDAINSTIFRQASAQDQSVMRDVAEFTMLQRMFRLMFEGGFGADFPTEVLLELADETTPAVQFHTTPRWNPRPGELEASLFAGVYQASQHLLTFELDADQARCMLALSSISNYIERNEDRLHEIPMDEWNENVTLSPMVEQLPAEPESTATDLLVQVHELIGQIAIARELRFELEVDHPNNYSDGQCPPVE